METPETEAGFRKGTDRVYRCVAFQQFPWLDHGFSTRQSIAPLTPITTLRQIHSAQVLVADGLADRECEGDALVSNTPGKRIGVRTADCVPILLADDRTRAISAIHAGWRGTVAGIVPSAVEQMIYEFDSRAAHIHAAIGPAIRSCCYEVGPAVADQFRLLFPEGLRAHSTEGHLMLDLVEANRKLLRTAGIPEAHIYDSRLCTACGHGEFHSYRRDPSDTGRMVSFIAPVA